MKDGSTSKKINWNVAFPFADQRSTKRRIILEGVDGSKWLQIQKNFWEMPQNHRVAEAGRNLWKPSGPTQRKVPRTTSSWLLKVSKEEDSTIS